MSDERLKPCPFCGGEAVIRYDNCNKAYIECKHGCVRTPSYWNNPVIIIETWNTRKPMEWMSDLIDKRTAVKIAESYGLNNGTTIGKHSGIADLIAEELSNLPTIKAEPVRHGEWIGENNSGAYDDWYCSKCYTYAEVRHKHRLGKYCGECGAKMINI